MTGDSSMPWRDVEIIPPHSVIDETPVQKKVLHGVEHCIHGICAVHQTSL